MSSYLMLQASKAKIADLQQQAAKQREQPHRAGRRSPATDHPAAPVGFADQITIRRAQVDDQSALVRLAALDSAEVPSSEVLLAEVGSELWAAIEISTGTITADPFRPTRQVVELLSQRTAHLQRDTKPHRRPRFLPRVRYRAA